MRGPITRAVLFTFLFFFSSFFLIQNTNTRVDEILSAIRHVLLPSLLFIHLLLVCTHPPTHQPTHHPPTPFRRRRSSYFLPSLPFPSILFSFTYLLFFSFLFSPLGFHYIAYLCLSFSIEVLIVYFYLQHEMPAIQNGSINYSRTRAVPLYSRPVSLRRREGEGEKGRRGGRSEEKREKKREEENCE